MYKVIRDLLRAHDGQYFSIASCRSQTGTVRIFNFLIDFFMKYFFRLIRWPLGQFIILIDWLTRPRRPDISPERRIELDQTTELLKLYHFKQCPFCVKTRRTIHRLGLNIETRDARNDPKWNQQLVDEGGKYQVPCLRIVNDDGSVEWLYESDTINNYLDRRFG